MKLNNEENNEILYLSDDIHQYSTSVDEFTSEREAIDCAKLLHRCSLTASSHLQRNSENSEENKSGVRRFPLKYLSNGVHMFSDFKQYFSSPSFVLKAYCDRVNSGSSWKSVVHHASSSIFLITFTSGWLKVIEVTDSIDLSTGFQTSGNEIQNINQSSMQMSVESSSETLDDLRTTSAPKFLHISERRFSLSHKYHFPKWRSVDVIGDELDNLHYAVGNPDGFVEVLHGGRAQKDSRNEQGRIVFNALNLPHLHQNNQRILCPITFLKFLDYSHILLCNFAGFVELWHLKFDDDYPARLLKRFGTFCFITTAALSLDRSHLFIGTMGEVHNSYVKKYGLMQLRISTAGSLIESVHNDQGIPRSQQKSLVNCLFRVNPRLGFVLEADCVLKIVPCDLKPEQKTEKILIVTHCTGGISVWKLPLNEPLLMMANSSIDHPIDISIWYKSKEQPFLPSIAVLKDSGKLSVIDLNLSKEKDLCHMKCDVDNNSEENQIPEMYFNSKAGIVQSFMNGAIIMNWKPLYGDLQKFQSSVISSYDQLSVLLLFLYYLFLFLFRLLKIFGLNLYSSAQGILPRSIFNALEENDSGRSKKAFVDYHVDVTRIYPTSPKGLLNRRLKLMDYEGALNLTQKHKLDSELVHKYKWLRMFDAENTEYKAVDYYKGIDDTLSQIKENSLWVLDQCLYQLPINVENNWKVEDLFRFMEKLLNHGMYVMQQQNFSKNTQLNTIRDELKRRKTHLHTIKLLHDVQKLNESEFINYLQFLRNDAIINVAIYCASKSNFHYLTVLANQYHDIVRSNILAVLATISEVIDPELYLEPVIVGMLRENEEQNGTPNEEHDYGDGEKKACELLYKNLNDQYRKYESVHCLSGTDFVQWVILRAREIEQESGLVNNSLKLVLIAQKLIKLFKNPEPSCLLEFHHLILNLKQFYIILYSKSQLARRSKLLHTTFQLVQSKYKSTTNLALDRLNLSTFSVLSPDQRMDLLLHLLLPQSRDDDGRRSSMVQQQQAVEQKVQLFFKQVLSLITLIEEGEGKAGKGEERSSIILHVLTEMNGPRNMLFIKALGAYFQPAKESRAKIFPARLPWHSESTTCNVFTDLHYCKYALDFLKEFKLCLKSNLYGNATDKIDSARRYYEDCKEVLDLIARIVATKSADELQLVDALFLEEMKSLTACVECSLDLIVLERQLSGRLANGNIGYESIGVLLKMCTDDSEAENELNTFLIHWVLILMHTNIVKDKDQLQLQLESKLEAVDEFREILNQLLNKLAAARGDANCMDPVRHLVHKQVTLNMLSMGDAEVIEHLTNGEENLDFLLFSATLHYAAHTMCDSEPNHNMKLARLCLRRIQQSNAPPLTDKIRRARFAIDLKCWLNDLAENVPRGTGQQLLSLLRASFSELCDRTWNSDSCLELYAQYIQLVIGYLILEAQSWSGKGGVQELLTSHQRFGVGTELHSVILLRVLNRFLTDSWSSISSAPSKKIVEQVMSVGRECLDNLSEISETSSDANLAVLLITIGSIDTGVQWNKDHHMVLYRLMNSNPNDDEEVLKTENKRIILLSKCITKAPENIFDRILKSCNLSATEISSMHNMYEVKSKLGNNLFNNLLSFIPLGQRTSDMERNRDKLDPYTSFEFTPIKDCDEVANLKEKFSNDFHSVEADDWAKLTLLTAEEDPLTSMITAQGPYLNRKGWVKCLGKKLMPLEGINLEMHRLICICLASTSDIEYLHQLTDKFEITLSALCENNKPIRAWREKLLDMLIIQDLMSTTAEFDLDKFHADDGYKLSTIIGVSMTEPQLGLRLANRYGIPILHVLLSRMEYLACDLPVAKKDFNVLDKKLLAILNNLRENCEQSALTEQFLAKTYPAIEQIQIDRFLVVQDKILHKLDYLKECKYHGMTLANHLEAARYLSDNTSWSESKAYASFFTEDLLNFIGDEESLGKVINFTKLVHKAGVDSEYCPYSEEKLRFHYAGGLLQRTVKDIDLIDDLVHVIIKFPAQSFWKWMNMYVFDDEAAGYVPIEIKQSVIENLLFDDSIADGADIESQLSAWSEHFNVLLGTWDQVKQSLQKESPDRDMTDINRAWFRLPLSNAMPDSAILNVIDEMKRLFYSSDCPSADAQEYWFRYCLIMWKTCQNVIRLLLKVYKSTNENEKSRLSSKILNECLAYAPLCAHTSTTEHTPEADLLELQVIEEAIENPSLFQHHLSYPAIRQRYGTSLVDTGLILPAKQQVLVADIYGMQRSYICSGDKISLAKTDSDITRLFNKNFTNYTDLLETEFHAMLKCGAPKEEALKCIATVIELCDLFQRRDNADIVTMWECWCALVLSVYEISLLSDSTTGVMDYFVELWPASGHPSESFCLGVIAHLSSRRSDDPSCVSTALHLLLLTTSKEVLEQGMHLLRSADSFQSAKPQACWSVLCHHCSEMVKLDGFQVLLERAYEHMQAANLAQGWHHLVRSLYDSGLCMEAAAIYQQFHPNLRSLGEIMRRVRALSSV